MMSSIYERETRLSILNLCWFQLRVAECVELSVGAHGCTRDAIFLVSRSASRCGPDLGVNTGVL
jgi:hypothetical protein